MGDRIGPDRHGGGTIPEVQLELRDVPRVIGVSVRQGVDQGDVLEFRRLSHGSHKDDVSSRRNERSARGGERLVEREGSEGGRDPQGIRIRGGGSGAHLDREETLRVVRDLSVAQGRGGEDEVVARSRIGVRGRIGCRRLLLPVAEIPLETGLGDKGGRRDGRAESRGASGSDKLVIARDEDRTGPQIHECERTETGDDDDGDDDQDEENPRKFSFRSDRRDLRSRRSRRYRLPLRLS